MKKIKNWIIKKLGGVSLSAIPLSIQQQLINHWTNQAIDQQTTKFYSAGFTSYYSKDDIPS